MHYGLLWLADRSHSNSDLLTKGPGLSSNNGSTPTPPLSAQTPHLDDHEALLVAGQILCPLSWSCCCVLVMNSRPIGWTSCVSKRVLLTIRKWSLKGGTWMQRCSFRRRGALGEGEARDLVQSNHRQLFREFWSNGMHLPVKQFSVSVSLAGKTSWQDLFSKVMLIWLQTLDFFENPMKALCVGKVTAKNIFLLSKCRCLLCWYFFVWNILPCLTFVPPMVRHFTKSPSGLYNVNLQLLASDN